MELIAAMVIKDYLIFSDRKHLGLLILNETYQIRLARENELYQLNAIEEAASQLFENTKFALEVDQDSLSIDLLREQQAQDLVWVAVDDRDNPVGFAVVMVMGDRIHLHELSVTPEHGRKGLGTRLIETITQFAESYGFTGVTLSTFRDIPWNAAFYKKLGFRAMKDEEIGIKLQNIRTKEAQNGLPISERILMILTF